VSLERRVTDVERVRRLPWMIAGDTLTSMFCALTVFGSTFILFLRELGLESTRIGLVLALIPFGGIVAPFIAGRVARFGFKRTFITFWGIRKLVIALLLFTPWVLSRFGATAAFAWVAAIVLIFAICRGIAETGFYPWFQEVVPNAIRGQFGAINSIVYTVGQIIAVAVAGFVVDRYTGLGRYMYLIGAGVVLGLAGVATYIHLPGGQAIREPTSATGRFRGMLNVVRDSNFRFFLIATALVTLGGTALLAFVPLYAKEYLGLSTGRVVLLGIGTHAGALLSSYLWGWSSDRYGSKPVVLSGLYLMLLVPLSWLLVPRQSAWSFPLAMGVALLGGLAGQGWSIGWSRYLFVTAVPAEKKTLYMPVHYAWSQLIAGAGPLAAGVLLDLSGGLDGRLLLFQVSPHAPLFILSLSLLLVALVVVSRMRSEGDMPVGRFVSLFWKGNPLLAAESLLRYRRAGPEDRRMVSTAHMGEARNPLNLHEMLEALADPSLNVRYEAILAIARQTPEPELVQALLGTLRDGDTELRLTAAWALGKMGARQAILDLRATLSSDDLLLRARSARSLAMLGDLESVPSLLHGLRHACETGLRSGSNGDSGAAGGADSGVCLAYASALGTLGATEALPDVAAMLRASQDVTSRDELALVLARMVGQEGNYIRLWRAFRNDPRTAGAQALLILKPLVAKHPLLRTPTRECGFALQSCLTACERSFAEGDASGAVLSLIEVMRHLDHQDLGGIPGMLLQECMERLVEFSSMRQEYVVLALHVVHAALSTAVPVGRLASGVRALAPELATPVVESTSE
jgi:MFS family permease